MFKKKNRKGNYPKCLTKTEKISLILAGKVINELGK